MEYNDNMRHQYVGRIGYGQFRCWYMNLEQIFR